MSSPPNPSRRRSQSPGFNGAALLSLLDTLTLGTWGALLLHYWRNGELNLLIHPAYAWLTVTTGFLLVTLAGMRLVLWLGRRSDSMQHLSSLPRSLGAVLLLAVALGGFWVPPKVFASDLANDREVAEFMTLARPQPQGFRAAAKSEDRSIVDWVRTLNVYPEPDAYAGQSAKVQGFVIHPPELPDNYLLLAQFVITCCAADVYPVGLPVALPSSRTLFSPDAWLEVQGTMTTVDLNGNRKLVIQAETITEIDEPDNPYAS
ncbi:TIGR03943 family putative permease subunit [Prochlorothrix hollandica]|uniref:TIGR03943 family putative permease subunit n=1 Tax=Prochlorothrix hollandica TaxID=1223 RepID=UPI0033419546